MSNRNAESPVLGVTTDPAVLERLRQELAPDFDIHLSRSPQEALFKIDFGGVFSVVVSDLQVPDPSGVHFQQRIRERLPSASQILLIDQTTVSAVVSAVNQAQAFHLLVKPWRAEELKAAVEGGIQKYQEHEQQHAMMIQTLHSSLDVMIEAVTLTNPDASHSVTRVRRLARELCHSLGIRDAWEVELASIFSHIATLTLPAEVMVAIREEKVHELDRLAIVSRSNVVAQRLVSRIPRMGSVRNLVRAAGRLARAPTEGGDLAAAIVYICTDLGRLLAAGVELDAALTRLQAKALVVSPDVAQGLADVQRRSTERTTKLVTFDELRPGMRLIDPIHLVEGTMVTPPNTPVTLQLLERLNNLSLMQRLVEPFRVTGVGAEASSYVAAG